MPDIRIPELSLVVLIGASGSGKSTFARRHFKATEVLSSDYCRGLASDDENDQSATPDAFEILRFIASRRLRRGLLTVVDATNVAPEDRKWLVELAREYHTLPVAIVLNLPERVCHDRNREREDRRFGPHVVRRQNMLVRSSLRTLKREGFRHVFVLETPEGVEAASIVRELLWNNLKHVRGPFDIIGDIHGCYDELRELLEKLGYEVRQRDGEPEGSVDVVQPPERKAVFLGDLVDRGPKTPAVLRLVMGMVAAGTALCVPGNHDMKLLRKLWGKDVRLTHGLAETMAQLDGEAPEFIKEVATFLDELVSHYVLDDGKLVVAHAGMKEALQGRGSGAVREFALYGETTGETDEFGLPVRYNWAAEYRGRAAVVYGHTPVPEPEWINHTINIDTGCVFGGRLTALRYPERELVSVAARREYAAPGRPFLPAAGVEHRLLRAEDGGTGQHLLDDLLDLDDVLGKLIIETRLHGRVTIREQNSTAALEVMSRFAANPKWLVYLPPTMSPSETSTREGMLEHPAEAFAHFRSHGVGTVVCQEKHMGSRAVAIVCRDAGVARQRFGVSERDLEGRAEAGIIYTRTGRRFFEDDALEGELLRRVRAAAEAAGLFESLSTDWLCLDCELMPWSAKARALLQAQYAPVGAAGVASLRDGAEVLAAAAERLQACAELASRWREREEMLRLYREAYGRYCWEVNGVEELRLAPFHLLASAGKAHVDKDHLWHMDVLGRLCEAGEPVLFRTSHRTVDLSDPASESAAVEWWEEMTGRGGEGMVIKPMSFVSRGPRGPVQPAVKCRGREYLRIIYGPEYTAPEHLERLRSRGLGAKRSLALREFALGVEGLERFVRREPLRRVHECVFGVLALESEPVDPRL
jgi:protein phosphatase